MTPSQVILVYHLLDSPELKEQHMAATLLVILVTAMSEELQMECSQIYSQKDLQG
jgi:hypothetical protein